MNYSTRLDCDKVRDKLNLVGTDSSHTSGYGSTNTKSEIEEDPFSIPHAHHGLQAGNLHAVQCDEDPQHKAEFYCLTCRTNLCNKCSDSTHSTRTLIKHIRVPLLEKPHRQPHCAHHPNHPVQFVCLEEHCQFPPLEALMCGMCKDRGSHSNHKHVLLSAEAQEVRTTLMNTMSRIRNFTGELMEWSQKIEAVICQIEGGVQMVTERDGTENEVRVKGSVNLSRECIKKYFGRLRKTIMRQEKAAMEVVEAHTGEQLSSLKHKQEQMAHLLADIASICQECHDTIQRDDAELVMAKSKVTNMLHGVEVQEEKQFTDLPKQLHFDPNILITFSEDNCAKIGPQMDLSSIVMLGLDNAGKSSILNNLKHNICTVTNPTIGFNVESIDHRNKKFTLWDFGGQKKLRMVWKYYYFNTQAVIFVMDSSDEIRMPESYEYLVNILHKKELKHASILIFVNKQDIPGSLTADEISNKFNLLKVCSNRNWHIQGCDTRSGNGVREGFQWLCYRLMANGMCTV